MITKEQAIFNNEFHYGTCTRTTGPRGGQRTTQTIARRNGKTKLWVTRPNEFRVPIKHGLREHGYITESDTGYYHTLEDCPINQGVL